MAALFMGFVIAIVTWAGNVALAYVRALPYLWFWLTSCTHSPIALGVFSVSFLMVLVVLLMISAQPVVLRLVLFFYSASPFSRWTMTRDWQPYGGTSLAGQRMSARHALCV